MAPASTGVVAVVVYRATAVVVREMVGVRCAYRATAGAGLAKVEFGRDLAAWFAVDGPWFAVGGLVAVGCSGAFGWGGLVGWAGTLVGGGGQEGVTGLSRAGLTVVSEAWSMGWLGEREMGKVEHVFRYAARGAQRALIGEAS